MPSGPWLTWLLVPWGFAHHLFSFVLPFFLCRLFGALFCLPLFLLWLPSSLGLAPRGFPLLLCPFLGVLWLFCLPLDIKKVHNQELRLHSNHQYKPPFQDHQQCMPPNLSLLEPKVVLLLWSLLGDFVSLHACNQGTLCVAPSTLQSQYCQILFKNTPMRNICSSNPHLINMDMTMDNTCKHPIHGQMKGRPKTKHWVQWSSHLQVNTNGSGAQATHLKKCTICNKRVGHNMRTCLKQAAILRHTTPLPQFQRMVCMMIC